MIDAWRAATATPFVDGGTYAMVRGPRFETPAEIRLLASFADLVGMTWPAECILAGEAGLSYAVVCKVDNLANGVQGHTASVEEYREQVRGRRPAPRRRPRHRRRPAPRSAAPA